MLLKGIPNAIFRVGDSRHQFFNSAVKQIDALMSQLGARQVVRRYGDRSDRLNDFQTEFNLWCETLYSFLNKSDKMFIPGQMRLPLSTSFRW